MNEVNLILRVSIGDMSVSVHGVVKFSEVSNGELAVFNRLGKASAVNGGGWWAGLLHNPLDDGVLGSTS
jgi:carbon monoxide dehydrogenase subunit G